MHTVKTLIYQSAQIREMEQLAQERFAISAQVLMQRAGKAAFDYLLKRWPQVQKITVFCGAGNNGGDGYVLARHAHERGMKVNILQIGNHQQLKTSAHDAMQACQQLQIAMHVFSAQTELEHTDLIVDAICGIGAHDVIRNDTAVAINKMQHAQVPIFAIDVPSGINADTGEKLGIAVCATATMTFIGLKLGLLTGSGCAHVGELVCHDLQLPTELLASIPPVAEKIHLNDYGHYLKPRKRDWHKGLSGHVLVIGGAPGFSGAARMAAEAALRIGAGLVSVATHRDHAALLNITRPEIMCHAIQQADALSALMARAKVIVLGPGLGQSPWAQQLWQIASTQTKPLVVDADGLNLLAQTKQFNPNWVLTPHPGEAARLLATSTEVIQQDRLAACTAISNQYGGTCVLKGAGSIIIAPHSLPVVCDKGNPGMASAGMGDLLSGVIAGLMAQDIPLGDAAKLGVYLHAMAGDLAAKEGERGMLAMDLLPYLRRLINQIQ